MCDISISWKAHEFSKLGRVRLSPSVALLPNPIALWKLSHFQNLSFGPGRLKYISNSTLAHSWATWVMSYCPGMSWKWIMILKKPSVGLPISLAWVSCIRKHIIYHLYLQFFCLGNMQQCDSLSKPEFGETGNSLANRISSKAEGAQLQNLRAQKLIKVTAIPGRWRSPVWYPMVPAFHLGTMCWRQECPDGSPLPD